MAKKLITKEEIDGYLTESDYYKILGVARDAKTTDIEKTFRKLSVRWHPDKLKVIDEALTENAHNVFKKMSEAKDILIDEEKREIYNKYGLEGLRERGPEMSPEHQSEMMKEAFRQMFGEQIMKSSVPDLTITEEVSLEDLYTGRQYKKMIERLSLCIQCNGHGTQDGQEHKCTDCRGSGVQIRVVHNGHIIQHTQQICNLCRGGGMDIKIPKCTRCNGKKLMKEMKEVTIVIPRGAHEGIGIGIKEEGNEIPYNERRNGISRTNLNIKIKEKKHNLFERGFKIPVYKERPHPKDLKMNIKLSLVESLTGFSREIKLLDGKTINLVHEKIIKHNEVMVLSHMGMPKLDNNSIRGHIYVVFDVEYPDDLNATTKRRLWQLLTNTPYKELKDVKNKIYLDDPEKYKFENITNPDLHEKGFPFPGFNNNYGQQDTSDDEDSDSRQQQQQQCKMQ